MKTILCPTDFSHSAQAALQYATSLALLARARLVVVHAIPKHSIRIETVDEELVGEARQKLQDVKDSLQEQGLPENLITTLVINLFPLNAVVQKVARAQEASLIVMGMGAVRNLQKSLLSSSAMEVLESVNRPVLIIHQDNVFTPLQRILVTTDLKGDLPADFELVLEIAHLFKAQIAFLHVVGERTDQNRSQAQERFNRLVMQLPDQNVTFHCYEHQNLEEGVQQFAQNYQADLLVMTTRLHSFWHRFFESSHTQKLACRIDIPLLVIHANG